MLSELRLAGFLFQIRRVSLSKYYFSNLTMLENRIQLLKTLQIFLYGSVCVWSWTLCAQDVLRSHRSAPTWIFIQKFTVMNFLLETSSYCNFSSHGISQSFTEIHNQLSCTVPHYRNTETIRNPKSGASCCPHPLADKTGGRRSVIGPEFLRRCPVHTVIL